MTSSRSVLKREVNNYQLLIINCPRKVVGQDIEAAAFVVLSDFFCRYRVLKKEIEYNIKVKSYRR